MNPSREVTTPWGLPDNVKDIGDGILVVTTPSHGGVFIPAALRLRMPGAFYEGSDGFTMNRVNGWFEEDCDMAIAIVFFPEHFRRYFGESFDRAYSGAVATLSHAHATALAKSFREDREALAIEIEEAQGDGDLLDVIDQFL